MSIFSRLFKGPEEGDQGAPLEKAQPVEAQAGERPRTPSANQAHAVTPATDGRGTMRPVAPSFEIKVPSSEQGAAPIAPAPVVQVGEPESKKGSESAQVARTSAGGAARTPKHPGVPPAAQQSPVQPANARTKPVGSATVRWGNNGAAPAPAAPQTSSAVLRGQAFPAASGVRQVTSEAAKPSSGAQRVAPPAARPSGSALRKGPSPPGAASHPKTAASRGNVEGLPKVPTRVSETATDDVAADGLLTLEFGSNGSIPQAVPQEAAPKDVGFDSVNNLLSDLDVAFGAIFESGANAGQPPCEAPPSGGAVPELRDLFASLAGNHMRQVREFMIGLKWGEAPRNWVSICEPAVGSLLRAATEMGLPDLSAALADYREALVRAAAASGGTIAGETREGLVVAYAKLAELMPLAFGLEGERGRREGIIVHALLQQVPDVRKVTIDKIYAAGLTNLDNLFVARPEEISATTGIAEGLASRIVDKFQAYRREIASLADATRAFELRQLADLAVELRQLHQEFERAASEWSEDARAEKKKFRQARAEALLQVRVLLARLGEIDRLGQLERLPFGRKIEELEGYLREKQLKEVPIQQHLDRS
jgi:hypothetical protein